MQQICDCELVDERPHSKVLFKLVRKGKDGNYKNTLFEASTKDASTYRSVAINRFCISLDLFLTEEIISKITLILESQGSEARRQYLEHDVLTRRSSKSSVTSQ